MLVGYEIRAVTVVHAGRQAREDMCKHQGRPHYHPMVTINAPAAAAHTLTCWCGYPWLKRTQEPYLLLCEAEVAIEDVDVR